MYYVLRIGLLITCLRAFLPRILVRACPDYSKGGETGWNFGYRDVASVIFTLSVAVHWQRLPYLLS